jgi:hypothetical protein
MNAWTEKSAAGFNGSTADQTPPLQLMNSTR